MRAIAVFEAMKGLLVLLVGFGVLSLIHEDIQRLAGELVRHFHFDPDGHYPRIFVETAEGLTDMRLWLLATLAFSYTALRLVEAWGLWRGQRWAKWLAVAVGGIYLPIEIYELLGGLSVIKAGTLIANLGIVLYMGNALWRAHERSAVGSLGGAVAIQHS